VAEIDDYLASAHAVGEYLLLAWDRACRAAGVGYFVTSGTLLGAVRSGGWIPWDDDIDVTILREDFETLKGQLDRFLPDGVIYSSQEVRADHITPVPRLLYVDSHRVHEGRRRQNMPVETRHVPLDIFILDHGPRSERLRQAWSRVARALDLAATARYTSVRDVLDEPGLGRARRVAELVTLLPSRILTHRAWCALRTAWVRLPRRCGVRGPLMATNYATPGGRRMSFELAWHLPRSTVEFEGNRFSAPGDTDAVLTEIYGADYLTPPPAHERQPIHMRGGLDVDRDLLASRTEALIATQDAAAS